MLTATAVTKDGRTKTIVAATPAKLSAGIALVQNDNVTQTKLDINNPSDGNKFGTVYSRNPAQLK